MYKTVKALIESAVMPSTDFVVENANNFSKLRPATEKELLSANFNAKKVPVTAYDGRYVIEFSDGVDKVMKNMNLELSEAVEEIARVNRISVDKCVLLVDESVIDKVDLSDVIYQKFTVARH